MMERHKKQRQRFILSEIKTSHSVKVKILAGKLGVTERTIRRDLEELEKTGLLRVRYGGAVLINESISSLYKENYVYLHTNMDITAIPDSRPPENRKGKVVILGSFNTDLVYRLQRFPNTGETTQAMNSYCLPGGKGSNQAVACTRAGAHTHFVVKVGEDEFADKAKLFFNGAGLEKITLFTHPKEPTGSAIVLVSEEQGDNAIVINPGANQTFSVDEVVNCYDAISDADVFLTQMENNPEATSLALKFAHACGLITIFNPAPWREEVRELIPFATIVTPNLTEAEAIISTEIITEYDIRQAAEAIFNMGPQFVIITLGSKGCWLFDGKAHLHFSAWPAVNVDTAGAGDAFNGALSARLAYGDSIETAINYASAFASLAVERNGAANMPDNASVIKKMSTPTN